MIRGLSRYAAILVATIPTLFRSQREQAIVELALRQQLAACMLFVWFVITHGRREVLYFDVTEHPTAPWVIQQPREAFPDETSTEFLIHDNDAIFSAKALEMIEELGIDPEPTLLGSPWPNGTAERWVGSVRRKLLDHVVVLDELHLRRLLRE